jgi:hypothetical protein
LTLAVAAVTAATIVLSMRYSPCLCGFVEEIDLYPNL